MPIPLAAIALGAGRAGAGAAAGGATGGAAGAAEAGALSKFGGSALKMAGVNSIMSRPGAPQQNGGGEGAPDVRGSAEQGFSGLLQTGQFH